MYLLTQELFKSPSIAWIAMNLASFSPFLIHYSHEARHYSLWICIILLSNYFLLKGLRVNKLFNWAIYTLITIIGFYTSFSHLFVGFAQGIYVAIIEKFKINQKTKKYLYSICLALFCFSPWLGIAILRSHQAQSRINWTTKSFEHGIPELIFRWLRNLFGIFSSYPALSISYDQTVQHPWIFLLTIIPTVLLVGYSIYSLLSHTSKSVWLLIILIMVITISPFILPDLISGGRRSSAMRYLLPCYLGVYISIAYFLGRQAFSRNVSLKTNKLWQIMTIILLLLGIYSSFTFIVKANSSNDPSRYADNQAIIALINQADNPLIISEYKFRWTNIFTLSYSLESHVKFQLINKQTILDIPLSFSDYFLYEPSQRLLDQLKEKQQIRIEPIYPLNKPKLWQVYIK